MNRVLIADDSRSIRFSLRKLLEDCGLQVTETENGADCLQMARLEPFDLIVTDLEMPVMDGFTLCAELKQQDSTRAIPIVIFSSLDSEAHVEAGFQLGACAFVAKTNADELRDWVFTWMERHHIQHHRLALVVDDSPTILKAVAYELSCDGYQVKTAPNGEQALAILNDGYQPDIIVSDLHMPGMGGLGLLTQLRQDPQLRRIPVVMMSSDPGRASILKTIQAGAVSFLTKPFGYSQLAVHLDRILSDQFSIINEARKNLELEQQLLMAAMTSLVNALEAKDHYTRGHSEAVAEMAGMIGRQLGLDQVQLDRLELAGRLHDLGKIGIRDAVLLKSGPLTPEEYDHIKTHVSLGETILSPIPSIQDIVEAMASHHERWDGSGYPRGLAGEQIPLFGRIIAIADVYDALISVRSYRVKMTTIEAIKIIKGEIGTHFCPRVGAAFLRILTGASTTR